MQVLAFVRRACVVAALAATCAPLAYAGRGGATLDEPAHVRALAPTPAPHASQARAHGRTGVTLEEPALPAPVPATSTERSTTVTDFAPSQAPEHSLPAGGSEHHGDKHERAKAATGSAAHVHRPLTQRSKGASRNAPATPGMGLLLRIGATSEREISLLFDNYTHAPIAPRSGRAPPRSELLARLAPAASPCASPSAAIVPSARPLHRGALNPPVLPFGSVLACVPAGERARPCEHALWADVDRVTPILSRLRLVHARRSKGVVACPIAPFGGRTA